MNYGIAAKRRKGTALDGTEVTQNSPDISQSGLLAPQDAHTGGPRIEVRP